MASAVPAAWSTRHTAAEQREVVQNHVNIAVAIAKQNPKGTAKAMELHFHRPIDYLVQARYQPPYGI
jgi:DNA-binding FadR family transcriptional regulator